MKWLGGAAVLCVAVGSLLFFPGRQERACFRNLIGFDHSLNCSAAVHRNEQMGIVSNGVCIDKERLLRTFSKGVLRCPITGKDYVLTFTVGEHPYCPVHGRLIEKYGYRQHGSSSLWTYWMVRDIAGLLAFLLGIVLAGIAAFVRLSRTQGRMAQPPDGSVAAGDSEGREK